MIFDFCKYKIFIFLLILLSVNIGISQVDIGLNTKIKVVTPKIKTISLIKLIEEQAGVKITYSIDQFDDNKLVNRCDLDCTAKEYLDMIVQQQNLQIVNSSNEIYLIKNYSKLYQNDNLRFSGYIKDFETNELLIGAVIKKKNSNRGTITDENGYFNINIVDKLDTFLISYIGYSSMSLDFNKIEGSLKSEYLLRKSNILNDIIINSISKGADVLIHDFNFSKHTYKMDYSSSTIGNNDILKSLTILPGVDKNNDFQNGISVNGLSPGDNIYYLDGIRIYEPNHTFGLFSVFNNTSINKVSIFSQDIPLKYQGAFSSVVDSHLKEGSVSKQSFDVSLSNSYIGVYASGPLYRKKTSYLLDIRRSILDLYIPNLIKSRLDLDFNKIAFYDTNIKITHRIKPGNKLKFHLYNGNDNINIKNASNSDLLSSNTYIWKNLAYGLEWEYLYKNSLKSNFYLSVSEYSNHNKTIIEIINGKTEKKYFQIFSTTNIRDISVKNDLKYYGKNGLNWNFGYGFTKYNLLPYLKGDVSENIIDDNIKIQSDNDSIYYSAISYLSTDYMLSDKMEFSLGVQLGIVSGEKANFFYNPYFSLGRKISSRTYLRFNFNRTSKFIHSLGSYSIGIPALTWAFSDKELPISYSNNFSIDIEYRGGLINIKSAVYYKLLKDILELKNVSDIYSPISSKGIVVPTFTSNQSVNELISIGDGYAYGTNVYLKLQKNKWRIINSYSINRTKLSFNDLNNSKEFVGKYDMPFSTSLYVDYSIKDLHLFTNISYHSGQLFSLPTRLFEDINGNKVLDYSLRNNERMSNYQSITFGIDYSIKRKRFSTKLSAGVSNLLNSFNPVYVYIYKNENRYEASQVSGLPILPYLKVSIKI